MRKVIIDCDTGIDDALALLLALRSPELNVLGITCVNGNVTLDKVVINTLKVVDHSGKATPVFSGVSDPLLPEKSENAPHIHGTDGLGDLSFPEPKHQAEKENAIAFIIRTLMNCEAKLDVISLGPLTNLALALREEPKIIQKVGLLTMMAGAVDFGNTRPMSEFNVFADPEAAKIVFDSDLPKMMVPLDPLWHGGQINHPEIQQIEAAVDKPWCGMTAKLLKRSIEMAEGSRRKYAMGEGAIAPPDLLTVAIAIDPSIGKFEDYQVFVETTGEYTRGMTVIDRRWNRNYAENTNRNQMAVCLSADQKKYSELVLRTLLL
jgi:inosine-uridine nucleoside N-ribohydrolase